jgi:hypothetical protein
MEQANIEKSTKKLRVKKVETVDTMKIEDHNKEVRALAQTH